MCVCVHMYSCTIIYTYISAEDDAVEYKKLFKVYIGGTYIHV